MSMWSAFMITKIDNLIARRLKHALTLNYFWPNLISIDSKAVWGILTDNSIIDCKYDWDIISRSNQNTANTPRKTQNLTSYTRSYRCFLFLQNWKRKNFPRDNLNIQTKSNKQRKSVKRLFYNRLILLPNLFLLIIN